MFSSLDLAGTKDAGNHQYRAGIWTWVRPHLSVVRFFVREFTRIFANLKPIRADLRRLADSFGTYEKPPRLTVVTPGHALRMHFLQIC